jgi:hypothetical protein
MEPNTRNIVIFFIVIISFVFIIKHFEKQIDGDCYGQTGTNECQVSRTG